MEVVTSIDALSLRLQVTLMNCKGIKQMNSSWFPVHGSLQDCATPFKKMLTLNFNMNIIPRTIESKFMYATTDQS